MLKTNKIACIDDLVCVVVDGEHSPRFVLANVEIFFYVSESEHRVIGSVTSQCPSVVGWSVGWLVCLCHNFLRGRGHLSHISLRFKFVSS